MPWIKIKEPTPLWDNDFLILIPYADADSCKRSFRKKRNKKMKYVGQRPKKLRVYTKV